MEKFEPKDRMPFKEPLSRSPISHGFQASKFLEMKSNPDKLIREMNLKFLEEWNSKRGVESPGSLSEKAHFLARHINELKQYNINAPVDFVIGEGIDGKPALFAVVDKIYGNSKSMSIFDGALDGSPAFIRALDILYANLLDYLSDKVDKPNSFIMLDIFFPRQYMYGSTTKSEENKIYLVDVDPLLAKSDYNFCFEALSDIDYALDRLEKVYKTNLIQAREKLLKIKIKLQQYE